MDNLRNYMRYLGIDYGQKTIGLAVGNEETKIAFGRGTLENKSLTFVLEKIKTLCRQENISKIIIGLPLSLSGKENVQTRKTRQFAKKLASVLKLPIEFYDERLSTVAAQKLLKSTKNKEKIDQLAAQIILQAYLESANFPPH